MKKYLLILSFLSMFIVSSVFGQGLLGPSAPGPVQPPPVVPPSGYLLVAPSAGVQQPEAMGYNMQINAEGPYPVVGVSISVNGKTVEGLITHSVKVVDPIRNYTAFVITKRPGIVIKTGDVVKIFVIDANNTTATKSGIAVPGYGTYMLSYVIVW